MRWTIGAFFSATLAGFLVLPAEPASGAPAPCSTSFDYCVEDEVDHPANTPTTPGSPTLGEPVGVSDPAPGGVGGGGGAGPACTWLRDPGALGSGDSPGAFPDVGVRPDEASYLIFEQCDGELTGNVQWLTPGAPGEPQAAAPPVPPPPTAEQLAETIRVRLEGNLPQPVAATSPAEGEPAIVNHPTFLAIENWTDTVTDDECAAALCVTVTATPVLTWSPGEPDTGSITCTGGGTIFDPTGGSADDQAAAPGACAHRYRQRTGIDGRPPRWPGTATVTWALAWTSTSGAGGDLAPVTRTADIPRPVDEVQAVVVR